MHSISPLPSLVALLVAIAITCYIAKAFGAPDKQGRVTSIDGLRGYLAFFVFLHHSCIWYFYLRSGNWKVPPSNLYTHLGQSSVEMFFMITGFLFFSKINTKEEKPVDWLKLFISRLLRLVPLYVFVMSLLFCMVAILSRGTLKSSAEDLLKGALRWLSFTILGGPDLNGVENTWIIIAGVTWSLPYEWLFYFSLPILALFAKATVPLRYKVLSGVCVALILLVWRPSVIHLLSFLGGIFASILATTQGLRTFAETSSASLVVIVCIVSTVTFFPSSFGYIQIALLSLAFTLIANGNSLFGILTSRTSRTLGEMAYSIYLLHGLILFTCFRLIVGIDNAARLSPRMHWTIIVCATPVLIVLCFVSFTLIEQPAMRSTSAITSWLRKQFAVCSNAGV